MIFSRYFLLSVTLLLPGVFSAAGSPAENKIPRLQNPMIRTGNNPRIRQNSYAVFSATGENPTSSGVTVSYRLLPQSSTGNIFSGELFLPAGTKIDFKKEIFIENAEKFTVEAFLKGKRLKQDGDNTAGGQLLGHREGLVGFWNDDSDLSAISGWKDLSFHGRKFYPFGINGNHIASSGLLSSLQTLVVLRPDFSLYTPQQLEEVLEYAANGGCVIFADPKGTFAASGTLLKALLPIHIISTQKRLNTFLSSFPGLEGSSPREKELDFLYFLPPEEKTGLVTGKADSFPLLWEAPYGKGVVKVFAFLPDPENFPGIEKKAVPLFLSHIVYAPEREALANSYKIVLDLLTGFSVPGTGLVKAILGIYFVLLILLAVLAKLKKRILIFWGGSVLLAIVGTLFILQQARSRISRKEQLLATLRLTPVIPHTQQEANNSFFSVKNFSGDIPGEKKESLMGYPAIPFRHLMGRNTPILAVSTPVETREKSNGRNVLASFHIPPRSSRQYMSMKYSHLPKELLPPVPYTLHLGKSGLYLPENAPFILPEVLREKVENAFLVLPGRSVTMDLSGGRLTKDFGANSGELLKDALTSALEESLWKNLHSASGAPLLALVTPLESKGGKGESPLMQQGKEVFLYPVRFQVEKGMLPLTPELFAVKPNTSSRMLMEGGCFRKDMELMPDTEIDLTFELPAPLRSVELTELRIAFELSGSRMVKVTPMLFEGKQAVTGKLREDGSWLFRLKGKKLLDPVSNRGRLVLKSSLTQEGLSIAGGGLRSFTWGILSLELSGRGVLPGKGNVIY